MRLIETLSEYFNFTYEIINCHSQWGKFLPNKTWDGLIGLVSTEVSYKLLILIFYLPVLINRKPTLVSVASH